MTAMAPNKNIKNNFNGKNISSDLLNFSSQVHSLHYGMGVHYDTNEIY
jgi:hypothetical protein